MDKEMLKKKLSEYDELIKITKKAKDDAIVARTTSQTKLEASIENLKKYGVTPENAASEINKINLEIDTLMKEIEESIPMDLLRELKRI
jgi:hypothetical protein